MIHNRMLLSFFSLHVLKMSTFLLLAIRSGDIDLFQSVLNKYTDQFQADRTFTLILRLHHNVIKTAIR